MQISALLGITNPQVEVPSNGAPAGFEMLIAQLLAAAGGPEPPGAPPGETIPCGEKLTTPEPNALSIQPDSAADAQNANFAFAMALAQTDATGSIPNPPLVPPATPSEPIVEIAPEVMLSKNPAIAAERDALRTLLNAPELGITRIQVDVAQLGEREVTKGGDAVVPHTAQEETTSRAGAVVPRHPEEVATKGADAIVPHNAHEGTTRRVEVVVPRPSEEVATKGADALLPRNAHEESTRRAGAVVPRHSEEVATKGADAIVPRTGESTDSQERSFGEPSQDRSNSENPHQPKPTLIETAVPIAKATLNTKIESLDRPTPAHELVRALADRIETALATRPQERITIEFRPLDLGDIKVVLTQQNDQVEAQIITDNDRVRQAVHAVQAELRQSLEQRGVQLGAFSVSDFGSHQEPSRQSPSNPPRSPPLPDPLSPPAEAVASTSRFRPRNL